MEIRVNRKEIKLAHHIDMPISEIDIDNSAIKSTAKLLYSMIKGE